MNRSKQPLIAIIVVALLLCLTVSASAQGDTLGALTLGQPVIAEVTSGIAAPRYSYSLPEASAVSLQAFGETAQPTITIMRDGEIIASEANTSGAFVTVITAFLSAGEYVVEVGAANSTSGSVILVLQSQTPVTVTDLTPGSPVNGEVSAQNPVALYRLTALAEASYVYVDSGLPTSGVNVRLMNETTNRESGALGSDLLGGRFNIPAGSTTYRIEVEGSGANAAEPFTVCWVAASAAGCGSVAAPASTPEVVAPPQSSACTVTPVASAVNVRASGSMEAPIIASLQAGTNAPVIGMGPGGFFYNIQLGNVNGWVAASVVTAGGDCASVPVVQPPPFVPVATAVPTQPPQPTQPPAQPTQANQPTQPPQPTVQPPAQTEEPPSGPCLLTINSPVNVYTQPIAQVDYLQDQVQSGELIPTGRLSDNSWWKTNYGGAWVSTGTFGGAVTVSGNCSLPVVTP